MVTQPIESAESIETLLQKDDFIHRHIGPSRDEIDAMLERVGSGSLDELIESTVPSTILLDSELRLPPPNSESAALEKLRQYASLNEVAKSFIGMGYYGTHVPSVIARNVLENPGWYTAYTPYQAEIAQGRLEALLTFQQMVIDLTGMEMANASLLDEATAAAEAMALCKRAGKKNSSQRFFVADDVHPQTLDVVQTRAKYFGFEIVTGPIDEISEHEIFGALLQYPGTTGQIRDLGPAIETVHEKNGLVAVATDLLSLALLKPPGEMDADIVFGSAQRFGVPMGFGGPHAAFFATRDEYKRSAPGRIIGVSKDRRGKVALRMAMQTREQHIRRDKATSNICTAQALLANMAAFYAVYHGPEGIRTIAERVHTFTRILAEKLVELGFEIEHQEFFDTILIKTEQVDEIVDRATNLGLNLRRVDGGVGVSLDETTTLNDINLLLHAFVGDHEVIEVTTDTNVSSRAIPDVLIRTSRYLTHEIFNSYHCETEMLRFLKRLENRDFSLTHGMIPLGSCTMKLNATTEMLPVSWSEFSDLHPFAPAEQSSGYEIMINELRDWLIEITGYDAMSMQPNSGAQGEYAGLLAIRRYHESIGHHHRNICLIPSSAHGTNPASASMMGLKVVVVATDDSGNIDLEDLRVKSDQHSNSISSLMITYPSTHGVFEETVREACDIVHSHGGQVYMDGANMNALVGIAAPGKIGADVSHLNLHKTFCIPHGGGGPGMGPIGVKSHLAPFLPNHVVQPTDGLDASDNGAVAAAPFGSASILPISWTYIYMMGGSGLKKATQVAILSANYIAKRLEGSFDVLYKGRNGRVAHECIIDMRPIKQASGISEVDLAKRLMDYGFHAPTMSWPVPGTIMIEPTESESKTELDRFCDAMISIREEIRAVEKGDVIGEESVVYQAPHTLDDILDDDWNRPYPRATAVFPSPETKRSKFWPTVNRIDDVYGDRNFVCTCPPLSAYETSTGEEGEL